MRSTELARIERLRARLSRACDGVERGIGDDAAVLLPSAASANPGKRLVWTVDAQVEGVHFRRDLVSWKDEGYRSFMAAASDLAAMGSSPWCALSALVLPASIDDEALDALAEGQDEASREVGAPVVGGNLARGDVASITTTLLGTCDRAVERLARAGDGIWIAGDVGLAAAGLASLERKLDLADEDVNAAVLAWRRPRARIAEGRAMAIAATGAIDVSDGLARDLAHVAGASKVRAVLEEAALLGCASPHLAKIAARLGVRAIDLALHGGEDYALVAATPRAIPGFTRVGRFEAGEGLALETSDGTRVVEPHGFDHFA